MKKTFKLAEFFCGPGGMGYGAKLSKIKDKKKNIYSIEHVWASDYDQDSCDTYKKNINTKKVFYSPCPLFYSMLY